MHLTYRLKCRNTISVLCYNTLIPVQLLKLSENGSDYFVDPFSRQKISDDMHSGMLPLRSLLGEEKQAKWKRNLK